jgi:hypothetical protein
VPVSARDSKSLSALGFLTVVESDPHGLFGGFLVLDGGGRPLEFHCTAPVKTNRAQEILFGPTLEPYIYGEQIGQTLAAATKQKPTVICTDLPPVLALREHLEIPVVLIGRGDESEEPGRPRYRVDAAHAKAQRINFELGSHQLAVAEGHEADRRLVSDRLAAFAERLDLLEPFSRIREAIAEAQRSGR